MGKRQPLPINDYLAKIGCRPIDSQSQFESFVTKFFLSIDEYFKIEDYIASRCEHSSEDGMPNNSGFYNFKNENYHRSLGISFISDNHFLRNIGRVIDQYKGHFGKRVLDIGCENGVLSCFIATVCPDSEILAIDRCEKAIVNARKLAEELHLKNITFECVDLCDINDTFDTVFTSRTAHENVVHKHFLPEERFLERVKKAAGIFYDYAKAVTRCVGETGNMIAISRDSFNAAYLGKITVLSQLELVWSPNLWKSVTYKNLCTEDHVTEKFQFAVLERGKIEVKEIVNLFSEGLVSCGLDPDSPEQQGEFAEFMFPIIAGNLIFGKRLYSKETKTMEGEASIWQEKDNPSHIVQYFMEQGKVSYRIYDVEILEQVKEDTLGWIARSIEDGLFEARDIV